MAQALEKLVDPITQMTLGELGCIRHFATLDGHFHADLVMGYPVDGLQDKYLRLVQTWVGDSGAVLDLAFQPPTGKALSGVRHVIAVASGKGGVGKSTTAVNLTLGLQKAGAKVGLLDADIYGPSQGLMLGVEEGTRPEVVDQKFFLPIRVHGIEAISMSMLASERTPMVWRGPMASGALSQLLQQTRWGDLDYLIVDMPPGTGDIQLTLSQTVSLAGAVIVTTPQNIALADARKGIEMFSKVNVPILGIVENMSYFRCDECGKDHFIFASDGGKSVAVEYGTRLLGSFPLDPMIREQTDAGSPPVASQPESDVTKNYVDAARLTAASLWIDQLDTTPQPTISFA